MSIPSDIPFSEEATMLSIQLKWSIGLMALSANFFSVCFFATPGYAQTIQLPTFRTFSVQTTVSAPDRGSTLLGSNASTSSSSITRGGIPANRGIGSSTTLPMARVHVQIIDLQALDDAILAASGAQPLRDTPVAVTPLDRARMALAKTAPQSRGMLNGAAQHGSFSTKDYEKPADYAYMAIQNHPGDEDLQRDLMGDIVNYVELAAKARVTGQWSAAQVFYNEAWKRLPRERREEILEQIAELDRARGNSAKTKR